MDHNEPAGWIPPQYRELVYADSLSPEVLEAIRLTAHTCGEDGICRPMDPSRVRHVIGVKDVRTGEIHYNQHSTTPFLSVKIPRS